MRALTRKPLPAYLDLVQFLVERRLVSSKREAREVILAGRVKANSHTLGVGEQPYLTPTGEVKTKKVVFPHVPTDLRPDITVVPA